MGYFLVRSVAKKIYLYSNTAPPLGSRCTHPCTPHCLSLSLAPVATMCTYRVRQPASQHRQRIQIRPIFPTGLTLRNARSLARRRISIVDRRCRVAMQGPRDAFPACARSHGRGSRNCRDEWWPSDGHSADDHGDTAGSMYICIMRARNLAACT